MAARSSVSRRTPLLPPAVAAFLRRRAIESAGIALAACGSLLLVMLATFEAGDPSFNHATDARPANWLGATGAYTADVLLRSLGGVSVLFAVVLVVWGFRLVQSRTAPFGLWRLAALPPALLSGAAAASAIPALPAWPLAGGIGGVIGDYLYAELTVLAQDLGMFRTLAALPVAAVAVGLWSYLLGIRGRHWLRAANGALGAAMWMGRQVVRLATLLERRPAPPAREPAAAPAPKRRRKAPRPAAEPRLPTAISTSAADASPGQRETRERQAVLDLGPDGTYQLPPLELLSTPDKSAAERVDEAALDGNARLLESVLQDFGVRGAIVRVQRGPVVTRYDLEPAPGTRSARVIALADDIARSMSAVSARVAVIPGENAIGIELPNQRRETVLLRELLGSDAYERTASSLALVLGKDISGVPIVVDLTRMPHLLVAGTTGSGKSVAINAMILSLLYRLPPDLCKFIMIDPKMLELSVYDDIPHLLHPVVTDPHKAVVALKWAVKEMNDRYRLMSQLGVRNIAGYNKRIADAREAGEELTRTVQTGYDPESGKPVYAEQKLDMEPLPFLVVIVDEMADLMLVAGKDIEICVQSLAQKARAAGIHLILATQRPSVDVITGTIKANLPTRVSFQVTSKIDSRTVLGEQGAEQLLGLGDMLYRATGGQLTRIHGPFVSDAEVEEVSNFVRSQGAPTYVEAITEDLDGEGDAASGEGGGSGDELYDRAVALVCSERKASTSFIQRHLQIGYNRAARIIEQMEAEGVVSPANHVGKREVLARDVNSRED